MLVRINKNAITPKFHIGDKVFIQSKEKILQGLDPFYKREGCLFMNQMWDFCGKEFKVLKVINNLFDESRLKMYKARSPLYILNNIICNGVLEDYKKKCDRSCYLLWHEDWLEKKIVLNNGHIKKNPIFTQLSGNKKNVEYVDDNGNLMFCQLKNIHEITLRNSILNNILQSTINKSKTISKEIILYLKNKIYIIITAKSRNGNNIKFKNLDIHSGNIVKVRLKKEIQQMLDEYGKYKGCSFMREMYEHCGKKYKVLKTVDYFYDEVKKKVCRGKGIVLLENVNCSGKQRLNLSRCDRNCFLFWHTIWLKKIS